MNRVEQLLSPVQRATRSTVSPLNERIAVLWLGPLLLRPAAWVLLGAALFYLFMRVRSPSFDTSWFFNADFLYLPSVYRDLFEEGGRWAAWRPTPAPYFFPDMLLFFALDSLFGPFVHAILAYALVQAVLLALATQFLVRRMEPAGTRYAGEVAAVVLVAACILGWASGHFWPAQFALLSGMHFSIVPLALVSFGLGLQALRGSRSAAWGLGVLCALCAASDNLFIPAVVVPLAVSLGCLALAQRSLPLRALGFAMGGLGGSAAVGLFVGRWLSNGSAAGHLRPRPGLILAQFGKPWELFRWLFEISAPVMMIWAALLTCSLWIALACRSWVRSEPYRANFYALCLFTVLTLVTHTAAVIAIGRFSDVGAFHYLFLPGILPFLALAPALALVSHEGRRLGLVSGMLGAVAAAWALCVAVQPWSHAAGPAIPSFTPALVECLDRNQERYGLAWGISSYWNARPVSMFSRTGLRVHHVAADGSIYPWITSLDWYLSRRGLRSDYGFIIAEGLDMEALERRYGAPLATFRCPRSEWLVRWDPEKTQSRELEVHVYGSDFDAAVRRSFSADLQRLGHDPARR